MVFRASFWHFLARSTTMLSETESDTDRSGAGAEADSRNPGRESQTVPSEYCTGFHLQSFYRPVRHLGPSTVDILPQKLTFPITCTGIESKPGSGLTGMTLEEINEEIRAARTGKDTE
jgi:hypothetical protein